MSVRFSERSNNRGRLVPAFVVDDCFAADVARYRWSQGTKGHLYSRIGGKSVPLHLFVWGLSGREKPVAPLQIDHVNEDKLDNRMCNLRLATPRLNKVNSSKRKRESSLPLGVTTVPRSAKYRAAIRSHGFTKHLGMFAAVEEASQAYEEARQVIIEFEALKASR